MGDGCGYFLHPPHVRLGLLAPALRDFSLQSYSTTFHFCPCQPEQSTHTAGLCTFVPAAPSAWEALPSFSLPLPLLPPGPCISFLHKSKAPPLTTPMRKKGKRAPLHRKTWTAVFAAASLTTLKGGNNPNAHPLMDGQ